MKEEDRDYLALSFSDLLNYAADDVLSPIDPLTYRNPEGDSCLHIAAQRGDTRAVQLLMEAGLDANDRGDMGNTALHYARKGSHHEVCELLLQAGADPSIVNEFGQRAGIQ